MTGGDKLLLLSIMFNYQSSAAGYDVPEGVCPDQPELLSVAISQTIENMDQQVNTTQDADILPTHKYDHYTWLDLSYEQVGIYLEGFRCKGTTDLAGPTGPALIQPFRPSDVALAIHGYDQITTTYRTKDNNAAIILVAQPIPPVVGVSEGKMDYMGFLTLQNSHAEYHKPSEMLDNRFQCDVPSAGSQDELSDGTISDVAVS